MPVFQKDSIIYVGSSVSTTTTPVTLSFVEGLVASFTMPHMESGRVYLYIPEGTVESTENQQSNEEYRFNANVFWNYVEGINSLLE